MVRPQVAREAQQTFKYVKQKVSKRTGTTKVIELPTFKTMPIVNAFEEIQDTINNQKNIFGDLLTEGDLTILFGRSNVGKSFLSYQIGEAVARGKNVFDVMDIIELRNYGETRTIILTMKPMHKNIVC